MDLESEARMNLLVTCHFYTAVCRGVATGGSISEPNKVQQFQFQTSGILLFMGIQNLYGPEMSHFLPYILQFLENLRRLFIFSYYVGKIDHFTLDPLKRFDT